MSKLSFGLDRSLRQRAATLLDGRCIERDVSVSGNDLLPLVRKQKPHELNGGTVKRLARRFVHIDVMKPTERILLIADVLRRRRIQLPITPGDRNRADALGREEHAGA